MRSSIAWAREALVLGFRHPRLGGPGERLARRHLERQVADPRMREALRPEYRLGCKRILISNRYYPALQQPNVTLVPHAVSEIRPHSIIAADGVERHTDVIVAATGFRVTDSPASHHIRGRDGRTLAEHWNGRPQAYKGTTIAGFPNLYMLLGPHTGLGHTSVLLMIESQINYILGALRAMDEQRIGALEPRAAAQTAFVAGVRGRARGTVWESGGCASWYLDAGGHSVLWPDSARRFRRALRRFDLTSCLARPYSSSSP
jgi:cation diffusion facilitator CzcD-associated flavoprotein CzcO